MFYSYCKQLFKFKQFCNNVKLTLNFFINTSTVGNSSPCTCLKAALYCTSSFEHAAVYLENKIMKKMRVFMARLASFFQREKKLAEKNRFLPSVEATVFL